MAKISVDTNLMRECGSNISSYAQNYVTIVNHLYKLLDNVNKQDIWTGKSADNFVKSLNYDKKSVLELGVQLKKYGSLISSLANKFDRDVSKNNM